MADQPPRVDACLVAAGMYHDIDYARLELLTLFAEHPSVRVRVLNDYEDVDTITSSAFLVSYTCNVRPSERAQHALRAFVEGGGRWMALHGTNSALDPPAAGGAWSAPRCFPVWAHTLGSQFVAHPPIAPFPVIVADADHWLVRGIEPFETDDELYLSEYHDREQLHPLLHTHFQGDGRGFTEHDWSACDPQHLVMYLRPLGAGSVLYNTLGHCRGHWDMPSVMPYYPRIERCSWDVPQYRELLRRGLRWCLGEDA